MSEEEEEERERVFLIFFLMCEKTLHQNALFFTLSLSRLCVEISELYKDPPLPYSQHTLLGENI